MPGSHSSRSRPTSPTARSGFTISGESYVQLLLLNLASSTGTSGAAFCAAPVTWQIGITSIFSELFVWFIQHVIRNFLGHISLQCDHRRHLSLRPLLKLLQFNHNYLRSSDWKWFPTKTETSRLYLGRHGSTPAPPWALPSTCPPSVTPGMATCCLTAATATTSPLTSWRRGAPTESSPSTLVPR